MFQDLNISLFIVIAFQEDNVIKTQGSTTGSTQSKSKMAIGSEAFVDGEVRFGLLDYFVLALTLIISSGIGIYYRFTGGKQKTAQEYLLGDKNMSVV